MLMSLPLFPALGKPFRVFKLPLEPSGSILTAVEESPAKEEESQPFVTVLKLSPELSGSILAAAKESPAKEEFPIAVLELLSIIWPLKGACVELELRPEVPTSARLSKPSPELGGSILAAAKDSPAKEEFPM